MDRDLVRHAQASLGDLLKGLFGQDLIGVAGYGAGLDRISRELRLKVAVNDPVVAERARRMLPPKIGGLTVDIEERGKVRRGSAG